MSKKVVMIIGIVLGAVIIALGVLFLISPDQSISTGVYSASYKGDGKAKLTITVTGELPEGFYWHVLNSDDSVVTYDIVKQTEKKVKVKLNQKAPGKSDFFIFANSSEEINDPYAGAGEKYTGDEAYEADTSVMQAVTANCEIQVDKNNLFHVFNFTMEQRKLPILLIEGMPYPIYYVVNEGSILFTIPDADEGWHAEGYDEDFLEVVGPYYNNGTDEFTVYVPDYGESEFRLSNYLLNSGVIMTIFHENVAYETVDEKTSAVVTNYIDTLAIKDAIINPDRVVDPKAREQYEEIIEVIGSDVPLPDSGGIAKMTEFTIEGENVFEFGNDIVAMEYVRETVKFDYEMTKNVKKEVLLKGIDEFMESEGAVSQEQDVDNAAFGKLHVYGYLVPNNPSDKLVIEAASTETNIDAKIDTTIPCSIFAYWDIGDVTALLHSDNAAWDDAVAFIADIVNKTDDKKENKPDDKTEGKTEK